MHFVVTSIQTIKQCDLFIYLFILETGLHYVAQSGLELAAFDLMILTLASYMLGLQLCITTLGLSVINDVSFRL